MAPLIDQHQQQLFSLCVRFRVHRLDVFGSAASDRFDPNRSDLDFLVEFEPLPPAETADCYLGLLLALEDLFGRPIDLVTTRSIQNPYFRRAVENTRERVYAA
jgi:hypothetical protein